MKLDQEIEKLVVNPKKLFLIDGVGALLSAFLLGVVLVLLEKYFGIPTSTLFFLASFPIFFAVYDYYCYKKEREKLGRLLQLIAILNILYCFLSMGFAVYHYETITYLGWIYISIEILIILVLAVLEFKVAENVILNIRKVS